MKLLPILSLFVALVVSLEPVTAGKDADDDVTVEEISEEEYKEQQKQEAKRPVKDTKPEAKEAGKPNVKDDGKAQAKGDTKPEAKEAPKPNVKDDGKAQAKGDAKPEDVKSGDAKTEESGTPESGKEEAGKAEETGKPETGTPETGKTEETSEKQGTVEDLQSDEAKGELEEDDWEEEEEEEEHEAPSGIRDPRPCEVCKYLAVELQGRLMETGKVKEFIETGHGIMPGDRKRKAYKKSELRFIEAVYEPHVCDKILDYDIHAERKRSLRYAKGSSETRKTLHWLRLKGVKVDMGMPEEMWTNDSPSNEISHLQRLCFELVEMYEDDIEDWYWGHQEQHLYNYLCRDKALKTMDQECLKEEVGASEDKKDEEKEEEKQEKETSDSDSKTKGDEGTPSSSMPPAGDPTSSQAASHSTSAGGEATSQTASPTPTKTATPSPSSQSASSKEEL